MQPSVETLFARWRERREPRDLAAVFDCCAAQLWRVGYHLTSSRNEADDLLQTTFLAAMQSAAHWRAEQALEPWLAGILANKLRMQRRRARLAVPAAFRADPAEDPAALAERAELRSALQQRIAQLDEPYRAVLVLQLDHGLTPAEIAHALGRPRATVRSQLQRGLELLRRGLPLGLFGAAARGMVVPQLAAVRAAVVAAAGGGGVAAGTLIGAGAVVMVKKLLVACLVVLVAGASVWWAWPAATQEPEPLQLVMEAEDSVPTPAVATPDSDDAGVRTLLAIDTQGVGADEILIRVVDDLTDTPVAGAECLLVAVVSDELEVLDPVVEAMAAPISRGVADAEGILRVPRQGERVTRLVVQHAGYVRARTTLPVASSTITVRLQRPGGIIGSVVTAGSPAGMQVAIYDPSTPIPLQTVVTDALGGFVVRDLAPGTVKLAVYSGDAVTRLQRVYVEPGSFSVVVISCDAGGGVSGVVVDDATGIAVTGAVLSDSPGFERTVVTGTDGSFRLGGMRVSGSVAVFCRHEAYAETSSAIREASQPVLIRLRRGGVVEGTVVQIDGTPIPSCYVACIGEIVSTSSMRHRHVASDITDAYGRFSLKGLRSDADYSLVVKSAGHGLQVRAVTGRIQEGGRRDMGTIVVGRRCSIAGFVVDPNGRRQGGVVVTLGGTVSNVAGLQDGGGRRDSAGQEGDELDRALGRLRTRSDRDGSFRFCGLASGTYTLGVEVLSGAVEKRVVCSVAEGQEATGITVVTADNDRIHGVVKLAPGTQLPSRMELDRMRVRAVSEQEFVQEVAVDEAGRFTLRVPANVRYSMYVETSDENLVAVPRQNVIAGSTIVELYVEAAQLAKGRVVDASGTGTPALVWWERGPGRGAKKWLTTARDGSFVLGIPRDWRGKIGAVGLENRLWAAEAVWGLIDGNLVLTLLPVRR